MQKTNQILVEKLNSKNENAYEVVKTNDDIVEMKRKQYTQIEDGTTKVSVISEQFLNITSRKRQLDKGDTDRIYKRRTLQAKKMEQLVEHVAGGDEESKAGVVAKYLDQQDPKFVEVVAKKSKALKENKKFTPAQADMKFVQNFTPPDFQAKNLTPSISPNFNSFSKKKHKK